MVFGTWRGELGSPSKAVQKYPPQISEVRSFKTSCNRLNRTVLSHLACVISVIIPSFLRKSPLPKCVSQGGPSVIKGLA